VPPSNAKVGRKDIFKAITENENFYEINKIMGAE
jgi:hypothetical protein